MSPQDPSDEGPSEDRELLERTPFGDIHDVEDVEGIGSTFSQALAAEGIEDTEQLWVADPEVLAERLDVAKRRVRSWQDQAELMALNGVGPQYAELMVRAGIRSIGELAVWEPDPLLKAVEDKQAELDVRIQGAKLTEKRAARWIEQAQEHDPVEGRTRRS